MDKIQKILTESIERLIENSSSQQKLAKLRKTHDVKLHFIPYQYRIFGGILQSMNIQFGNFIEKVIDLIIRDNTDNEIIEQYSGKKSNNFTLSKDSDALIDSYISTCQSSMFTDEELLQNFSNLISIIKNNEADKTKPIQKFDHDVDILFRNKITNVYYYVEIKYNDDHDTDKFVGINRKLLKTFAYLQRELGCEKELKPILFYFNNKKMKGNIYLPENSAIYRGKRFFDTFTKIKYEDLDIYMKNISESPETKKIFDDLYQKIVKNRV